MYYLTIITRTKNEPFIEEFVNYHLSQGVDFIHILDDHSTIPVADSVLTNQQVAVHQSPNFHLGQMVDANALYSKISHDSEWFMVLDVDEFVTTKKTPHHTIRDELLTTFKDADCIKVPWVMMSCNNRANDPKSLLGEQIHRWNHDARHPHPTAWHKGRCRYEQIEIKSIFRGRCFKTLANSHHPGKPGGPVVCVDGVYGRLAAIDPFYQNLREADIAKASLLCYHYRIISRESCLRKIATSSLQDYKTDIDNLMACDFPELVDTTMQEKYRAIKIASNHSVIDHCES